MTQKDIIIAVIVAAVVILGGWYLFAGTDVAAPIETGDGTQTGTTTQPGGTQGTVQQPTTTKGSLRAVVAQGGNYTCTISTVGGSNETTGTVYSSDGKTRLDLLVRENDGTKITAHVIRSGSTSYTWVDGQQTGIKTAITPSSSIVPMPSGGIITETDLGNVSSTCHPWLPDTTQFTPPVGITFTAL